MGIVGLRVLPGRGRKAVLQATHQPIVEAIVASNGQSLGGPISSKPAWK